MSKAEEIIVSIKGIPEVVEQLEKATKEIERLNNIINGIEEYCKVAIAMNFNMNNSKIQEQIVDDYTNVLDKLKELKEDNNGN